MAAVAEMTDQASKLVCSKSETWGLGVITTKFKAKNICIINFSR